MSHVWLNSAYQTQSYLSNSVQISKILIPSIPENYSLPLPPHSRYDITLKLIDKTWQWCYYDNSCTPTTGTSFNTLSNSITLFSLSFNTSSMSLVSIHDILPTSLLNSSQSIYTPSDFESRRLQKLSTLWPSVSELIIQNKRTILVFANTSYIPLKSDALYIFNGSFIPSVNSIPLLSQDLISTFSSRQILTPQICSRITNSQTISQSSNNTNFPAVLVTQPIQNQTFENLVGCGYSPVASSRVLPVVWTWDTDQPQNTSTLNCVVIQSNNRFRNVDCSSNYKYACKDSNLNWIVSKEVCTNSLGLVFGVPETAFDALRAGELCRSNGAELFINLHQVERFCWVSGDDACPYTSNGSLIPLIIQSTLSEGIIILVLGFWFFTFKIVDQSRFIKNTKRKREVRRKLKMLDVNGISA